MVVLFLFGVAHGYLIWGGDILAHYALVGAIAFLFARLRAEQLFAAAITALLLDSPLERRRAVRDDRKRRSRHASKPSRPGHDFSKGFGAPPREWLNDEIAAMQGPWRDQIAWRWEHMDSPLVLLKIFGIETLAAVLFGMWAYQSGFVTGSWERARYRRIAILCLGVAWTAYLLLGINTIAQGYDQRWVFFASIVATVPFRILGTIGYAALVILAIRPGGWLTERLAAVGRAAFTNYLGTSILVTAIFYGWGLGQFAQWDRATIYIVPPLIWLIMLLWSKPWLDRYRYGPLEWLWRSLSRLNLERMRKAPPALAARGTRSGRSPGCSTLRPKPFCGERVSSGLVALSNRSTVRSNNLRSSTTSGTSSSGKRRLSTQRRAVLSISSAMSASGAAPNCRASPLIVCAGMTSAAAFWSCIASSICATDLAPSSRK